MSQKSILSFFASPKPKPAKSSSKEVTSSAANEDCKATVKKNEEKNDSSAEKLDEVNKDESISSLTSSTEEEKKGVIIIPKRKTARKQFAKGKKIIKDHKLNDEKATPATPKSKKAEAVTKKITPEKMERTAEKVVLNETSNKRKISEREENGNFNPSDDDEGEIPRVHKKCKKNVITDDSPVKPVKKKKKVIDDDDDSSIKPIGKVNNDDSSVKPVKKNIIDDDSPIKPVKKKKKNVIDDDDSPIKPIETVNNDDSSVKPVKKNIIDDDSPVKPVKKKVIKDDSPVEPVKEKKKNVINDDDSPIKPIKKKVTNDDSSVKSIKKNISDDDRPIKPVKKKVINDDCHVKPIKNKRTNAKVESYSCKLDKFIMKPREDGEKSRSAAAMNDIIKTEKKCDLKAPEVTSEMTAEPKNATNVKEEIVDSVSHEKSDAMEVQEEITENADKKETADVNSEKDEISDTGDEKKTLDESVEEKMDIDSCDEKDKSPCDEKGKSPHDEKDKSPKKDGITNKSETKSDKKSSKLNAFFAPKHKVQDTESGENSSKSEKKGKTSESTKYCPSKSKYHPIDDACWKKGENVPYLALAQTLEIIEDVSGRLKMIEILANYLRSVIVLSPADLLPSVYLCLNRLAPEYQGIELGVGETLLMKAVAQATGRTFEKIKAEVANKGDLGLVAESSCGNQRVMFAFPKLTVSSVFEKFKEIAQMSGNSVMAKKTSKMQALFSACRDCEAKYIIRSLSGKLRIGLAEQSVLAALAQAAALTPPNQDYPPKIINAASSMSENSFKKHLDSQTLILKTTYCECPNYDMLIPILLKEGIDKLPSACHLTPGMPLKPMLAHPASSIDEVLRRFDKSEFTCEFKYDGERAQIHLLEDGTVNIYSRNQEDNTSKYPDIISRFSKALEPDTKSCILDTEVVAWDRETDQIRPFQVLSTRKRKDAVDSEITVQVCVLAFDLLYLNGESLVKKPLKERRDLLHKSFKVVQSEFAFVQSIDGNSSDVMQEFLEESIKGNCEGLMVKALEDAATYEIAKRSHNWLKLKKDYLEGVGDTLDLVVIGGWFGKGKRVGTYGGFLLACYDSDETEEFQTICKIGTGFKDEILALHTQFFKEHTIPHARSNYRYDSSLVPDQWFDAVQVWEVKCADLSISPVHKAASGIVDPEKGISLRFPRFLRVRDDKKPENATSSLQVAELYNKQDQIQNQKKKDTSLDDVDFY